MHSESSFFIYLYLFVAFLILLLGGGFYFLKRKYGNILFLSEGTVELSPTTRVVIKKVLPFVGEGYLIFVEVREYGKTHFEVWGFSKESGFRKISEFGETSNG